MSRIRFAPLPDPHVCSVRDTDDSDDFDVEVESNEPNKNAKLLWSLSLPGTSKKPNDSSSSASSSMHSLTPTQSIDSTTPPSKRSRWSRLFPTRFAMDKENSLTRWPSTTSAFANATADSLTRTQSTTSFRGGNVRSPKKSHLRRPSTADGMLATLHSDKPPGQRMLNGRVYGSKANKNLFASAPDMEPEFVEWGYGGMGSVRSQREVGGRMWGKVQSEVVEEDDGGGMAWVKRRKEERERAAREAAEAQRKAEDEKDTEEKDQVKAQEEHDTRAVNVPMHELPQNEEEEEDSASEEASPDDEDEDSISDGEARKTSLGAGVEKVSRHHKS